MTNEKPAPTAAEVAAARTWFEGAALELFADVGFPETARHVRTLLAALDAAEARATAAEDALVNTSEALRVASQEVFKFQRESVEWREAHHIKLDLLATAERERDEARAALVAIQERRFPIMHGPSIRWSVLAPHEKQAMRNHSQTLAQLADRGGLDPIEAMAVYEDHEYPRGMCGDQATAMRAAWRALVDRTDAQAKEAPRG